MQWRYQPLDRQRFPVGAGPFRARGLAYAGALRYVDKKLPGGRAAFNAALGSREPFYEQLFLAIADYDISPLVQLYTVVAQLERTPLDGFIAARARWSGEADSKGVWKRPLHGASAQQVAERLYFAFERYFPPCRARPGAAGPERFEGELWNVPACMDGLYAQTTQGFFRGALEGAGAREVKVVFSPPLADGSHAGVPVERLGFAVTWTL